MELIESFLTKNPCFASDRKITVKGLMLQSVGCPQPSAKVFLHNWNRPSYVRLCPHAIVDAVDGTVYQTLPWTHRGWHALTVANDNYIGVVICEPNQIKYTSPGVFTLVGDKEKAEAAVRRVYYSSVDLFAMLCKEFELDPMTQIFSYSDVVSPGPASMYREPEHLWRQLGLPFTMTGFKEDVKEALAKLNGADSSSVEAVVVEGDGALAGETCRLVIGAEDIPDEATEQSESPAEASELTVEDDEVTEPTSEIKVEEFSEEKEIDSEVNNEPEEPVVEDASFEVRIPVSNLRIRKGPGIGAGCEPIGKYTGIGTFRILEVQNGTGSKSGWGRLESGEGWICMDFVERI